MTDGVIRVRCHECGDVVEVAAGASRLFASSAACILLMPCPLCEDLITRAIPSDEVRSFVRLGVWATSWEPPPRLKAPRFTIDDLIDFHEELQDPSWPGDSAHTVDP